MAEFASFRTGLRLRPALAGLMLAIAVALACASQAEALVEVHDFHITRSTAQAGGHPDLTISFRTDNWDSPPTGDPCQCHDPKNIHIELPAGVIGNPHATPQCTAAQFIRKQCPPDTQIGNLVVIVDLGGTIFPLELRTYNLIPKENQAGLLGAQLPLFEAPIYTVLSARTGSDYVSTPSSTGSSSASSSPKPRRNFGGCPPIRATTCSAKASTERSTRPQEAL